MNKELCTKCQKRPITNKTHQLCRTCNQHRMEERKEWRERDVSVDKMTASLALGSYSIGKIKKQCRVKGCDRAWYTKAGGGLCQVHYQEKRKKDFKLQKKGYIKPIADKKRETKRKMSEMKKEAKSTKCTCEGCLKSFSNPLDYSHILSVKQRPDLELHPDNKNMLCRSCHQKWESWDPEQLLTLACFWNNIHFMRENDTERFWKMYFKFNDLMMFSECKEFERIDEEYNKLK